MFGGGVVGHQVFDVGKAGGVFGGVGIGDAHGRVFERGGEASAEERGDGAEGRFISYEGRVIGERGAVAGLVGEAFENVAALLQLLEFTDGDGLDALVADLGAREAVDLNGVGFDGGIERVDGALERVEGDFCGCDFTAEHEFQVAVCFVERGELGGRHVDERFGSARWLHKFKREIGLAIKVWNGGERGRRPGGGKWLKEGGKLNSRAR